MYNQNKTLYNMNINQISIFTTFQQPSACSFSRSSRNKRTTKGDKTLAFFS